MRRINPLSRRAFLRGTGVAMALPMLEAMTRSSRAQGAGAAATEPPRRMICINTSLGLHTPNLYPKQTGADYESTPYLKLIEEHRKEFTLFSGLSHPDIDGGHPTEVCFLTAAPRPRADN